MADTKITSGGGNVSGHSGQAARELLDELSAKPGSSTVLVPNPADSTGFRVLTLAAHHQNGMMIDSKKQEKPPLPAPALLEKLKDFDRPVTLIPQVYSGAAQRNVRFAVVLPKNFDPSKSYELLGLIPDRPPGTTLAEALSSKKLEQRIAALPGADNKIILLPERLEHRRDAMSGAAHDELAEAVLVEDLLAYGVAAFGGTVTGFDVERFSTGSSESILDGIDAAPVGMPEFSTSESRSRPSAPSSGVAALQKKLASTATGLMVRRGRDAECIPAAKLSAAILKDLDPLPDNIDLGTLKAVDRNVVIVAQTGKSPFLMIVPPKFNRERKEPFKVATFIPAEGTSFSKLSKELATKGGTGRDDTVVIVPHRRKGESLESVRRRTEYEVLAHARESGIDLDLTQYASTELSGDADKWRTEIKEGPARRRRLQSPMISVGDRWMQFPPTTNYKLTFPDAPKVDATETIPKALQKQSAGQGSMLVPTMKSDALGKNVRFATYLPPGYDPDSKEQYPVLVMLPGKGNPLNVWSSVGDMVPKLDRMMSGDNQKMIVVIPDSNDSFWYDYDSNGQGDFKEKEKRDYEGHIDEVIAYATSELKGDKKRMSIGGISRGGFGAVSYAARHPGMFKAVSAHAALLDLGHAGGVLAPNLSGAIRHEGHFGPPDDPVWAKFNPGDLVRGGAFQDKNAPRLYLDVGFEDQIAGDQTMKFSDLLKDCGVEHHLQVATAPETVLGHKWAAWEGMLESWISFHQKTYGKAAKPRIPTGWYDGKDQALAAYRETRVAREKAVGEIHSTLVEALDDVATRAEVLLPKLTDLRPFEWLARNEDGIRGLAAAAKELKARVDERVNLENVPLHAAEAHGDLLGEQAEHLVGFLERAEGAVDWRFVGPRIDRPAIDPKALDKIHADAKKSLQAVIKDVPVAKDAVMRLATARPELFTDVDDSVTKGKFAEELTKFIDDGVLKADEVEGFAEFLDRIASKQFEWRRGGYSHSVCSSMNIVFNHPGIILNMIRAARDDKPYKVKGVYSGDGPRSLKPTADFKRGFRPAPEIEHKTDPSKNLPPADLSYERGFLRAIVDEISPSPMSLPDDRFGANAGPVAVSMQKLTGRETNYLYANKIKNGADLAKAVASQGRDGLAMSDVYVSFDGYPPIQLHFPVFYDLDLESGTVAMQEWDRPPQRLDLETMKFSIDAKKKHGVGVYCEPNDGMQAFLTPEAQSNWNKIRPDKPKKFSFFKPKDDKWID